MNSIGIGAGVSEKNGIKVGGRLVQEKHMNDLIKPVHLLSKISHNKVRANAQ